MNILKKVKMGKCSDLITNSGIPSFCLVKSDKAKDLFEMGRNQDFIYYKTNGKKSFS